MLLRDPRHVWSTQAILQLSNYSWKPDSICAEFYLFIFQPKSKAGLMSLIPVQWRVSDSRWRTHRFDNLRTSTWATIKISFLLVLSNLLVMGFSIPCISAVHFFSDAGSWSIFPICFSHRVFKNVLIKVLKAMNQTNQLWGSQHYRLWFETGKDTRLGTTIPWSIANDKFKKWWWNIKLFI